MRTIKIETGWGSVDSEAKKAKQLATDENAIVEFEFNGIKCLVGKDTNLEWFMRDYMTAWVMDWKEIGFDCVAEYSDELKAQIKQKQDARDERERVRQEEQRKKDDAEKEAFEKSVEGVEFEFKDKQAWEDGLAKNQDPYGNCCYQYAEGWAKLMQVEIAKGKQVKDIANETSFKLGFLGITGFMYGAAVSILSHCWAHGEQLRKWHNKEYNHEGDGVVNPAVLTISA